MEGTLLESCRHLRACWMEKTVLDNLGMSKSLLMSMLDGTQTPVRYLTLTTLMVLVQMAPVPPKVLSHPNLMVYIPRPLHVITEATFAAASRAATAGGCQ